MAIEFIPVGTDASAQGQAVATDSIGAIHFQVMKIMLGADGATDNLVDSGQQNMAASFPVVIASDQGGVPVFLITGTAQNVSSTILNSANWVVAATQGGAWNISASIVNTGGYVMSVANSAGWSVTATTAETFQTVSATILNSAGWVVTSTTAETFQAVSSTILNSANWVIAATQGGAWNVSASIVNTGGYVMSMANTSISYNVSAVIINTGGAVSITNTGDYTVHVKNSAGWSVGVTTFADGKTYKHGSVNATATDNLIINAVVNSAFNVVSVLLSSVGPNTAVFQDDTLGAPLTGPVYLAASGGFVLNAPADPSAPWFKTTAGNPLGLNLITTTSVGGVITYYESA